MKTLVVSLGGSLFLPGKVDFRFLEEFKKVIKQNKQHKFVIVTGGGSFAREYIRALRGEGKSEKLQSYAGIGTTRMNARFLSYFFGQDPEKGIPHKKKEVKDLLNKRKIVFCGALEYRSKNTSDGTAAELAAYLKCDFVNLTLAPGLCTKNPLIYKNARLIPEISYKELNGIMRKMKYKPGQHFVIDQNASKIIMKHKIKTYILGKDMRNFDNFLKGEKFVGTKVLDDKEIRRDKEESKE